MLTVIFIAGIVVSVMALAWAYHITRWRRSSDRTTECEWGPPDEYKGPTRFLCRVDPPQPELVGLTEEQIQSQQAAMTAKGTDHGPDL